MYSQLTTSCTTIAVANIFTILITEVKEMDTVMISHLCWAQVAGSTCCCSLTEGTQVYKLIILLFIIILTRKLIGLVKLIKRQ